MRHLIALTRLVHACSVFGVKATPGYKAPTLTGHKSSVLGVFFAGICALHDRHSSCLHTAWPGLSLAHGRTGDAVASAARLAGVSVPSLISVSEDGAVHTFAYNRESRQGSTTSGDDADEHHTGSEFTGAACVYSVGFTPTCFLEAACLRPPKDISHGAGGQWWLSSRQFLQLRGAKVTAAGFHRNSGVLITAYSSGIFELHQMPDFTHLQVLSATNNSITAVTFNGGRQWLCDFTRVVAAVQSERKCETGCNVQMPETGLQSELPSLASSWCGTGGRKRMS